MDDSRRSFLKRVGYTALGVGCAAPLMGAAAQAVSECAFGDSCSCKPRKQWGLVIDIAKCRSAEVQKACSEACHKTHNVPTIDNAKDEVKWLWSEAFENAFPDEAHPHTAADLKAQPVLVTCNHCTNPPCVKVCPTEATWKRKQDGLVMMDMHRCIGCRYCIAACPYGARSFNWRDPRPYLNEINPQYPTRTKGVVEKCNLCEERLRDDKLPACVEAACKAAGEGAMVFGDLNDPQSEISRLLSQKHSICRRYSLGTGPNVFYIV
jgi:Fe-S-cluster-containing dehydrogenase component